MAQTRGTNESSYKKGPLLQLILQKYVQSARDSIRGPIALKDDLPQVAKSTPERKTPNSAESPSESDLKSTNFDGLTINCFNVGGEKRICFAELLQKVLNDFDAQQIFKKRDKLLIFTSKCTPKQLDKLKFHGILPWTTASSNLITKSDAFRLAGVLKSVSAPKSTTKRSPTSFEVYHECFGGCIGVFDAELYTEVESLCIQCTECNGSFSPREFVTHNHTSFDEVHTCHWGFDSVRWRSYLMLVEEKATLDFLSLWKDIKAKFDGVVPKVTESPPAPSKMEPDPEFVAYIRSPNQHKAMISPIENLRSNNETKEPANKEAYSAFRPWSNNKQPQKYSEHLCENKKNVQYFFQNRRPNTHQHHPAYPTSSANQSCACLPSSSAYMDCNHCRDFITKGCHSKNTASTSHFRHHQMPDLDVKVEPGLNATKCQCDACNVDNRNIEQSINSILQNCTSNDMKLTTNIQELAKLISAELNKLKVSQDERIREGTITNKRLQTELQLLKIECEKRVHEIQDTKNYAEQELETLYRKRQKEISTYNRMRWELSEEANRNKEVDMEMLQKEIAMLKDQLQQSKIDRENLHKQLTWQFNKNKTDEEEWTPFPSVGRKRDETSDSTNRVTVLSNIESRNESPAPKIRKLDTTEEEASKREENSDIEIEA